MSGAPHLRPAPGHGPEVVPPLSPAPAGLLADHENAHRSLDAAVREADEHDPVVRAVFVDLARRILVESLAHLHPVLADPMSPLLVPPPRAFLADGMERRRHGAAEAFRHVDARLAMVRRGLATTVLERSSPEVLNAILQSGPGTGIADDVETNPGLVRATPTNWKPEANQFEHPPAERCRSLLEAAVDLVAEAPAPAVVRAGWLAFTLNTVHPFVDGNGRTARACALAVAAAGLPTGMDWGLLEQWNLARTDYVDALRAGQRAEAYAADAVDPMPFVVHTITTSTRGAQVSRARLGVVSALVDELRRRGTDTPATVATATVLTERFVPLAALGGRVAPWVDLDAPAAAGDEVAIRLAAAGVLAWAEVPPGRAPGPSRHGHQGQGRGVVPGPAIADLAPTLTTTRF